MEKGGLVEVINKKQWQEIIKVIFLQSFYQTINLSSNRVSTFPSQ